LVTLQFSILIGGTVDISTQEVSTNGELKIIHKICGGPWEGECVNRQFMKIILELLGAAILKDFEKSNGHDLLLMTRSFERKKKTFRSSSDELHSIQIPIPYSLIEIIEKKKKRTFAEVIAASKYNEQLRFKRDKLTINSGLFMDMFNEPIQNIMHEIRTIFQHERCSDVSAIMMVGGFSEADVLQNAVQKAFSDIEVFILVDGSLSVLKGAVIYGHNPDVVSSRVCNFTYGISLVEYFDPKIHSLEKQYEMDGKLMCNDIFRTLFTIDEDVKVGDTRSIYLYKSYLTPEMQYLRSYTKQVDIFVCDRADPFYTTDEGCRKHATIIVNPPSGLWPEITRGRVELQIAGMEMVGTYIFNDTGERTAVRFEFLPAKSSKNSNRKRIFDSF
jgi:hypothetical protein